MLINTRLYFTVIILSFPYVVKAAPECEQQWIAKLVSAKGQVEKLGYRHSQWIAVKKDEYFCQGDRLRTNRHSRVTIELGNESLVTLEQSSTLSFPILNKSKFSWLLELFEGGAFFRSRHPHQLEIDTPFVNAVHEGTEFLVRVSKQQTEITVFDGRVAAENQTGRVLINKQQVGITGKDQITRVKALTIHPKDAVQWALYYPPIVDFQNLETIPTLQTALNAYQQGNVYQALQLLEKVPVRQQDDHFFALKASLLLTVGSVTEALQEAEHAQQIKATSSTALAIKTIIAVTQNRTEQALTLARKATQLSPGSAVTQIALSYALQAAFKIPEALEVTQQAVKLDPGNALAWARLAELQLSTGERSDALESAKKAQQLNPQLERTQTVLGFAYLAQIDIDEAKTAFNKAIGLNSADPLAWLGTGLAKIRKGDIKQGTRDLEAAVTLDPDNAIMRSYLGKAYYELRNESYAATELAIAKKMDPNDPTPWFYDAILKQTTNRPVEALHDMQKAIELNDNRGVYRSRLLLDEDTAARSANMARIYQDLGFDRVALKQAWTSLGQDYTNPSAHRFLSDTLQGRPRQRIARASELLQAQLFQPINTVPVQPQLTGENIGILNSTGPGSLSSNEYDPLFTSNGAHILLNGAIGSNDTRTDSAIITGVYDQFSISLGQFQYRTDGFRKNDDYKRNIYNAFAQVAITPDLNIQVEFKREDVTAGDVPLRFNGFHQENFRESIDQDSARFGLRYKISPEQDFIFSAIYTKFKEQELNPTVVKKEIPLPTIIKKNDSEGIEQTAYQLEAQYLFNLERFNFILGIGYNNLKSESIQKRIEEITTTNPLPFGPPQKTTRKKLPIRKNFEKQSFFTSYIYSQYHITPNLTTILGLSFENYETEIFDRKQINPKFGLIWNPFNKLTFRAAAFRTLKRPLTVNQTIEPTQIAGFNQFFDDNNGTRAWQYGIGIDIMPTNNLYVGGELFWRHTTEQITNTTFLEPYKTIIKPRDRDETSHLAYINWAPANWLTISTKYQFDDFVSDFVVGEGNKSLPRKTLTHFVPTTFNFFHPNGIFVRITANYINQKTEFVRPEEELNGSGLDFLKIENEDFWTFDAILGYRLPKKLGFFSLEIRNLFDNKGFKYNSVFDASGPQLTRFVPEREIFFKMNLSY